jgi:hypothetical protein
LASALAGGMWPMCASRRRLLNQSTHSSVAYSTASKLRQGPRQWMTSALKRPLIGSASAVIQGSELVRDSQLGLGLVQAGHRGWRPVVMGKALSVDLRVRVIDAIGAGMSRRATATRFGISAATAVRWAQLQRDTGSVAPAR